MSAKTFSLIVLGLGRVGRETVRQILRHCEHYRKDANVAFTFTALADSSAVLGNGTGLDDTTLHAALAHKEAGQPLKDLPDSLAPDALAGFFVPGMLLVDCSASDETTPLLNALVEIGGGIALANKQPLAAPWHQAVPFFQNPRVRYESAVGAGLPVIAALRDLRTSADEVTAIEGCMSGTLGFLCARLEQGQAFSTALMDALHSGYTEPDPRQDLDGRDVARKALILARTAGMAFEMDEIALNPFCPDIDERLSKAAFLENIAEYDSQFERRVKKAVAQSRVLRYLARVSPAGISVGLEEVEKNGQIGALCGSDNFFALHTRHYDHSPLVISGPGAGISVTAAGVITDLLRLATTMKKD